MWPRVVECMLGCWLAVSPFVFGHGPDDTMFWIADFTAALVVMTLALGSFYTPTRWAHWLLLGVALAMIAYGRLGMPHPQPPALQNHIVIGLLLLMFAIIPNQASMPPAAWRSVPSPQRT